jgi:O-antigen ligase
MFGEISGKTSVFLASMLFISLLILIKFLHKTPIVFTICNIDILLVIIVSYILISSIIKGGSLSNRTLELLGLCILYLSLRQIKYGQFIFIIIAIIASCIIQCVYGNLQLWGILESHHNQFSITGGFFNPGPYAGYLASSFPIILGLYLAKEPLFREEVPLKHFKVMKYASLFALSLIFITLPSTESRAAWLSITCTSIILLSNRFSLPKRLRELSSIKTGILLSTAIIVLYVGCYAIYKYKADSADGRLLIWKATLGMIWKSPIHGVGFDRFKSHYMNEQAEYIAQNPQSPLISVAGDVEYCFNEPLQFIAENGLIGLIIISVFVIHLFRISNNTHDSYFIFILKASLLGILIFGLFSYPSQVLPIKVNASSYMALLAFYDTKRWKVEFNINKILKYSVLFFSIIAGLGGFKYISEYTSAWKNWNKAYQLYGINEYRTSVEYYSKANFILRRNGEFLTNYGKALSISMQYDKAIPVLSDGIQYYPNIIALTILGDSYKNTKKYGLAEQSYLRALQMNPSRFYTRYLLAKLYDQTNQDEKAINMASGLLNDSAKVESTAVNQIKEEMKNILIRKKKK